MNLRDSRLFPAVAGAAAALLLLKVIDLSSDPAPANRSLHRYITQWLGGPRIVADPETTGSTTPPPKEKDAKAEAKPDATQAAKPDGKSDGKPGLPGSIPGSIEKPVSPAERGLLERLGERREQLEQRQRELDLRENLLKAADKKLEERIRDLRNLEGHKGASAGVDQPGQKQEPAEQPRAIKNLVTMYETMKPKEAARVFEKLDLAVLVPVVNAMNPRKMSEVLAAMSPESASRLTVELSNRGKRIAATSGAPLPPGELPGIDPKRP
jgi:flagellar motility protein MotE (MotC chaperone)